MSNRVYMDVNEQHCADRLWDVVVSDDYGTGVFVLFDRPPDDDVELLKVVLQESEEREIRDALDFIEEHQHGITIRGTHYTFDQIKEAFETVRG